MVNYVTVNFYAKLFLAVLLLVLVIRNVIKTIDGANKGKRIFTPAILTIYFLFILGSLLAIGLTILE
jgi:uncharacterized integral membrane protein